MKKLFLVFAVLAAVSTNSFAGDYDNLTDEQKQALVTEKTAQRDALKDDIAKIEKEQKTCKNMKGAGIALTTIGAAGVVGTGIAMGVQGKQISDKKKELDIKTKELDKYNKN